MCLTKHNEIKGTPVLRLDQTSRGSVVSSDPRLHLEYKSSSRQSHNTYIKHLDQSSSLSPKSSPPLLLQPPFEASFQATMSSFVVHCPPGRPLLKAFSWRCSLLSN